MSQKVSASASGCGGGVELAGQDVGEAAFFGLDDGAGVVRDQAAQQGFGVLDVAQVAGAVQAVQAGGGEFGEVADVVQPRGGLQQTGVRDRGRGRGCGPGRRLPGRGTSGGEGDRRGGCGRGLEPKLRLAVHKVHVSQPGRDVHGRGLPSEDV